MRFSSVVISLLLHACLAVSGYLFFPDNWKEKLVSEQPVPIELIREAELAELTSIPATQKDPDPVAADEPPELVAVEPEPAPEPEIIPPEPEAIPEPEIQQPTPEPEKKPEEVKPPKPKKQEPKEDDLFSDLEEALKDLDPTKKTDAPREAPLDESGDVVQGDRDQERIGLGDRLTASDTAKLRAAIERCWSPPAGAPEPEKLIVNVEFSLEKDGTIAGTPKVTNAGQIRSSGNPFWQVAEREAVTAVLKCAPYDFLPIERYNVWREVGFRFGLTLNGIE